MHNEFGDREDEISGTDTAEPTAASQGWRLPEDRFDKIGRFVALAVRSGHELRAYDDALDFVAGRSDAARRAAALADLFPGGAASTRWKKLLKVPLYPYQAEGALFAVRLAVR